MPTVRTGKTARERSNGVQERAYRNKIATANYNSALAAATGRRSIDDERPEHFNGKKQPLRTFTGKGNVQQVKQRSGSAHMGGAK